MLAFWFGEPDEVTPAFIRQAGVDALHAGETFYTHNLGIPELRTAIASYVTRLHRPAGVDNIAATNSGMSALMLTTQALVGPGDRVVAVTPLWPNLVEIPKILGAAVECVELHVRRGGMDAARPRPSPRCAHPGLRAVSLNSPTIREAWTLRPGQRAVLDHRRRHGIWIVADGASSASATKVAGAGTWLPRSLDLSETDDRCRQHEHVFERG